jgi:shikimate kinase
MACDSKILSEAARLARAAARPVTLVGLMGVGKTSVGRRLAARLGLAFVDADAEIELACGMTIPEIFARFGEAHFRDGERRVIARLVTNPPGARPHVVATGGGAFIDHETRALVLERSLAVWLDASIDTLVERTARRGGRPLLEGADPRETLSTLATARNPFYAEAPIHITSNGGPHNETVEAIIDALAAANTPGNAAPTP